MRFSAIAALLTLALSWSDITFSATIYHDPIFGVQSTTNLVYGSGLTKNGTSSKNLTLDIYRPTKISTPVPESRPTLIFIHGGGWQSGSKSDLPSQMRDFAKYGYNVVSINYRLLGDQPPPTTGVADDFATILQLMNPSPNLISTVNASIDDAHLAMEWLYANAATYGIDTDRIAVSGGSAGGAMALAIGHLAPSTNVQPVAVISAVGPLFNLENPYSADGPPTLLVAGATDTTVPLAFMQGTSTQLEEAGVDQKLLVQPNTGHTVNFNLVVEGKTINQHMLDFLAVHVVPEPATLLLAGLGFAGLVVVARRSR